MRIKKYTGKDMQEALSKVRADLGVEAVILNSRKVKRNGIAAWFAKPYFEVLAAVDENYITVDRTRTRRTPTAPEPLREAGATVRGGTAVAERTAAAQALQGFDEPRPAGTVIPLRSAPGPAAARRADAAEPVPGTRYGAAAYAAREAAPGPDERMARRTQAAAQPTARTPVAPDELEQLKEQVRSLAGRLEQLQEGARTVTAPRETPAQPAADVQATTASRETPTHRAADAPIHPGPASVRADKPVEPSARVFAAESVSPQATAPRADDIAGQEAGSPAQPQGSARFDAMRRRLIDQEVDSSLAERILGKVRSILPSDAAEEEIRRQTGRVLTAALGEPETIRLRTDGKPTVVAFIGPTGVGKTTTLAKIAADFTLAKGKRVGLVTADTYRIAAVEQLKTYAEILNLPVTVAYSAQDMREAVAAHQDKDLVLIDTAGRSHRNRQQFDELRQLLSAVETDEVYLVLSVNTGRAACQEILEHYTFMKEYRLLFTKLDESPVPGIIFNARLRTGKPISYVTTGQSVPDDLEVANPGRLAAFLAGLQT